MTTQPKKTMPFPFPPKKGGKAPQAKVEKREETTGKDLDHDGERGESPAHKKAILATDKKKGLPPAFGKGKSGGSGSGSGGKASSGKMSGKLCAACKAKNMKSCSHL